MLINLRNALMTGKRLPYDAEVEYLESTGTQWIDTGYVLSASDRIVVQAYFQANDNRGGKVLLGVGNPKLWITTGICRFNDENSAAINTLRILGAWNSISIDKDYCTCNGTTVPMSKGTFQNNSLSLWLFGANGSTATKTNGRIATCKIYHSGVLVRDYIAVRKGSVGYLYDRVSGKLFGNAGTGDFVVGQDVVPLTWADGYRYLSNGRTEAAAGKSVTDTYIPIVGGHTYTALCGAGGTTNRYCIVYNEYFSQIQNSSESKSNETFSFTATNSAAYMRMTANTDAKDSVYVHDDTDDKYIVKDGKMLVYNA